MPPAKTANTLLGHIERVTFHNHDNHYTIAKGGQRKIIHQLPWFDGGAFAGFVEISIPIPEALPHFDRG